MVVLGLLACSDISFTESTRLDVFQQNLANEVDLLVVIDDSCSMRQEQDNLGRNFDSLVEQFVEADVDWRIGVTTTDVAETGRGRLRGGDDEVVLRGPAGVLDRVAYTRDWPFERGASLELSAPIREPGRNDVPSAWCVSTSSYGDGEELGTPGRPNLNCETGEEMGTVVTGEDRGPRAPVVGDLVISEIHPMSLEDDGRCEWVELLNTSVDTIRLQGLILEDDGQNSAELPDVSVVPGDSVVIGRSNDACGARVDVALEQGFSLNDSSVFLERGDTDAEALFGEAVSAGTRGSGIEQGLEATRLVFEEPRYSEENQSWLRETARLAVLFVSDEEDYSPDPVDDYLDELQGLKGLQGYRDAGRVTVSAVVGTERPPFRGAPSCTSDNGSGFYAERYLAAANRTGGLVDSICADDFAPIVGDLGLTLTGLTLVFELAERPVVESLVVRTYDEADEDRLLDERVVGEDVAYDASRNALVFTEAQAPAAGTFITARYRPLRQPVSPSDEPRP